MSPGKENVNRWRISILDIGVLTALVCVSLSLLVASARLLHPYGESRVFLAVVLQMLAAFTFGGSFGFLAERLLCGSNAVVARGFMIGGLVTVQAAILFLALRGHLFLTTN